MRILYAAVFNEDRRARSFYAIDHKLKRAFTQLGHWVEPFSYRDVARRSNWLGVKKLGISKMNQALVETARYFRPDVVVIGKGELLRSGTLARIREMVPHVRVALTTYDPVYYVEPTFRRLAPHADAVFATMAGRPLARLGEATGLPAYFYPNPVDPAVEKRRPMPPGSAPISVLWTGSTKPEPEREAFARWVRDYPGGAVYGGLGHDKVFGMDYFDVLARARVVMGYNRHHDVPWYSSDRIANVMGSGAFFLSRHFLGMEDFFERGVHLDWFDGMDECQELAARYLADDALREKVAAAGRERVLELFPHTRVAEHILACTLEGDDRRYPVTPERAGQGPENLRARL
ncbi:MAG: glycosyltransferase [Nitrospirae bacterium]|nr:glycosyltransferase [Nitrospirota bacterium]